MTKRKYFGTDGIRGAVGEGPITVDFMLRLGNAVGRVLHMHQPSDGARHKLQVVIGKDTRISGYMIQSALEAGLISAGIDVLLSGPLPTPAVAHLTRSMRLDLGIVISASHNPFGDNGIKFFSAGGRKLPDQWELEVEELLKGEMVTVKSAALGKSERLRGAADRYIEFCKSTFDPNLSLKGLKIVVDAAHGAAYETAPATFHELGAEVVKIGCEPTGLNINDGYGATHTHNLCEAVKKHNADYGIALDGDADRLMMVDGDGTLYDGDQLLYILALDRKAQGKEIHGVIGTFMTNMGVQQALKRIGITMVRANVGDRYILQQLDELGWELGGESSGHLLDMSCHTTGDGTISALLVLQALARSKKSMQQLLSGVEMYPQITINVPIERGTDWKTLKVKGAIKHLEDYLGPTGRVLIRASGTEPVVRVMVECRDHNLAKNGAETIANMIGASQ